MKAGKLRLPGKPLPPWPPLRDALRAIALTLLLCTAAAACQSNIQKGIDSANELLYEKKYVESERLYRKLLKRLDSQAPLDEAQEAHRLLILDRLGKINALYLHDYNQALADYDTLVRQFSKTDEAFAARAMVADIQYNKLGNLQAAVDEYQRLVSEFPDRPETRRPQLKIVSAYFQLKNYEQARTEAETILKRWPNSVQAQQARFQIANSYYVQNRFTEAIATYEQLLEDKLDNATRSLAFFELGNCFLELGEADRALSYFYECLADHPNPALVQRKIRRVRLRMNKSRPADGIYGSWRRSRIAGATSNSRHHKSSQVARPPTPASSAVPHPAATAATPPVASPTTSKPTSSETSDKKKSVNTQGASGANATPPPAAATQPAGQVAPARPKKGPATSSSPHPPKKNLANGPQTADTPPPEQP